MGSHHAADTHSDDAPKTHPVLPATNDDARDTPMWVPALGVCLFVLLGLFGAVRMARHADADADDAREAPAAAAEPTQH